MINFPELIVLYNENMFLSRQTVGKTKQVVLKIWMVIDKNDARFAV